MKETKAHKSYLVQIAASLVGGAIFFYLMKYFVWWVPNLAEALGCIKEPLKETILYKVIAITILTIVSLALISLKKKLIVAFGLLEIVAGWWTIWATFEQSFESDILYSLAIGGGVFLLVNGFENANKKHEQIGNEGSDNKNYEK